ncbi:unnamed protein product [Adineta ricciae]|uniref:Uncharacterized protein n=1 Tax=Adineta ricciae TaxID=249248 RepID=A0A816AIW1_ADIRI|nr:unnamed protein product [Adineta ricciae]
MMKVDADQSLPPTDANSTFRIEQESTDKRSYWKDLRQSCNWIHLTHRCFDEKDWKLAFCSSSIDFINKYPNIFLLYRTILFFLTLIDLIHGIVIAHPIHEWFIYFTHLTLLITFFAVSFQFLTTCRVNFFRGDRIVPSSHVQYIHMILIVISLGTGLAICLLYWTFIYNPSMSNNYLKMVFDHGVLWILIFIDILIFTRLPIYMIDCIPIMIFACLYGLFTIIAFIFSFNFSNNRTGYVYQAFDLHHSPLRVIMQILLFIFLLPVGTVFILWNVFRLRRSIDVKVTNTRRISNGNLIV